MTGAEEAIECLKLANRASRQALDNRRRFGRQDREARELTQVAAGWRALAHQAAAKDRR